MAGKGAVHMEADVGTAKWIYRERERQCERARGRCWCSHWSLAARFEEFQMRETRKAAERMGLRWRKRRSIDRAKSTGATRDTDREKERELVPRPYLRELCPAPARAAHYLCRFKKIRRYSRAAVFFAPRLKSFSIIYRPDFSMARFFIIPV